MPYNTETHKIELEKECNVPMNFEAPPFFYSLPGGRSFVSPVQFDEDRLRSLKDEICFIDRVYLDCPEKDRAIRTAIDCAVKKAKGGTKADENYPQPVDIARRAFEFKIDSPFGPLTSFDIERWARENQPLGDALKKLESMASCLTIGSSHITTISKDAVIAGDDDKVELELPKKHKTHITL